MWRRVMSRSVARGTCQTRPGNDALSLEMYPIYHAFLSASNLAKVMQDLALEHREMARFDPQMIRGTAEQTYMQSAAAQAAEGRVRRDASALRREVAALNEALKWPLVRQMAADWAPAVRYDFLYREGELLGSKPLYGAGKEEGMDDEMLRSRMGRATRERCTSSAIPMTRWPVQEAQAVPPTLQALPARPVAPLGPRGNAPGLMAATKTVTERVVPGMAAVQLCTQGGCVR